jgi:hypothetical protein
VSFFSPPSENNGGMLVGRRLPNSPPPLVLDVEVEAVVGAGAPAVVAGLVKLNKPLPGVVPPVVPEVPPSEKTGNSDYLHS